MFVVRIDPMDGGTPAYKAFESLAAARQSLHTLGARVRQGEVAGVFLFETPGVNDASKAIETVSDSHGVLLERDPWGARDQGHGPDSGEPRE